MRAQSAVDPDTTGLPPCAVSAYSVIEMGHVNI